MANGERQTEILKQPQYQPLAMELQVISIYAAMPPEGRNSWVREVPVGDVPRYASELLEYVQHSHSEVVEGIRKQGKLDDDLDAKLQAALDAFAEIFQPSKSASAA